MIKRLLKARREGNRFENQPKSIPSNCLSVMAKIKFITVNYFNFFNLFIFIEIIDQKVIMNLLENQIIIHLVGTEGKEILL